MRTRGGEPELIRYLGRRTRTTFRVSMVLLFAGAPACGKAKVTVDTSQTCCQIIADAALKADRGRVVVNFPGDVNLGSTTVDVLKTGTSEKVGGWFGSGMLEVAPGTYDVKIWNKLVTGVIVQGGHDTQLKVGAIHSKAGGSTWADVLDSNGTKVAGGYGLSVGLPAGTYTAKVGADTEQVVVEAGKATEF